MRPESAVPERAQGARARVHARLRITPLLTRAALLGCVRERLQAERLPLAEVIPTRIGNRGILLVRTAVTSGRAGQGELSR